MPNHHDRLGYMSLRFRWILCALSIILITLTSCKRRTWIRYTDGQKVSETYRYFPRRSTTYWKKGKVIYYDSITERVVKKQRYTSRISCFGSWEIRNIEINYDSTGRRISRVNKLRREKCDSCEYRRVRVRW